MAKGKKGFEPGVSGNPGGRKKGAINKVARPIKELLSDFLNEKIQKLPAIWNKLNARDKAALIKDLLPFFLAKMQAVTMDVEINSLSDLEIEILCEKLFNKK